MGTLLYTELLYTVLQHAQGKRSHQTSQPQRGSRRPHRRQEGREAEPSRGGEEVVGLHQGEEAAGPREQAVLQTRQEDGTYLRQGQGEGLRYGQVFEDPPDLLRNHYPATSKSPSLIVSYTKERETREISSVILDQYFHSDCITTLFLS